jgi:hypothetical protein
VVLADRPCGVVATRAIGGVGSCGRSALVYLRLFTFNCNYLYFSPFSCVKFTIMREVKFTIMREVKFTIMREVKFTIMREVETLPTISPALFVSVFLL